MQALKTGLKRARRWQAAQQEASRQEADCRARATALVQDVQGAAILAKEQSRELAGRLEPVIQALAPLRALELAPVIGAMTAKVAKLRLMSPGAKDTGPRSVRADRTAGGSGAGRAAG